MELMAKGENLIKVLVSGIKDYMKTCGLKSMVLGLSGGLDSTVCAALCSIAAKELKEEGYDAELIGASLPCNTNQRLEVSNALRTMSFCDKFFEVSLEDAFQTMRKACETRQDKESTPISKGNIKARLRMIYLYNLASLYQGIVIDTDNMTECLLGFWTIHGDEGDFNPIGCLWKTEVYLLAENLVEYYIENGYKEDSMKVQALREAISLTPTDGNGVMAGGDLAQIAPGHTYEDVDDILTSTFVDGFDISEKNIERLVRDYGEETVNRVLKRMKNSSFKRKHRPFIVDLDGMVKEKNENVVSYKKRHHSDN